MTATTTGTIVPIVHACGHRVEYRWDAWEVTLGRHPDREPCAVCRRTGHHTEGRRYVVVTNPLTREVILWHDGWPFPMTATEAHGMALDIAKAAIRLMPTTVDTAGSVTGPGDAAGS